MQDHDLLNCLGYEAIDSYLAFCFHSPVLKSHSCCDLWGTVANKHSHANLNATSRSITGIVGKFSFVVTLNYFLFVIHNDMEMLLELEVFSTYPLNLGLSCLITSNWELIRNVLLKTINTSWRNVIIRSLLKKLAQIPQR